MVSLNKQAELLNKDIRGANSAVFDLFTEKGKAIFFPHQGVLGQTAEAKGKKLNATIGMAYEDDGSIMALDTLINKIKLDKNSVFPYASSFGKQELRKEWQSQILKKNPSLEEKNFSLPVVTNAVTHGLSIVGYLFADPETEIIIPEPAWDNYELVFTITYGAKISHFPLFRNNGFNLKGLKEQLNRRSFKKILLLNFPNNPTGYTPNQEEVNQIGEIINDFSKKNRLIVICDDAYFGLVYEKGIFRESIFSKLCCLSPNVLAMKVDGVTKEDYAWGLRIGFVTFGVKNGKEKLYSALEDKAAGAVRATISNASNLSQSLILQALLAKEYEAEKEKKRTTLQKRYETVKDILSKNQQYKKYFQALPYNSGYFLCLKLSGSLKAEQIRQHLLEKYDTGLIVVDNLLRVAYSSLTKEKLEELFNNIYLACGDIKS
ncbi:MAG: aspartate aminotransferase [Candidatus Kerfeldbacteria bacterium CG08_land_8_20_14_0_20_40_16]|uniref:Aspartate aminotransferase n=1 Tax=Candidatus Kerfeldbacteria bacterium CG08_land_8_20_14_0_20_40_16 TaxID=2014244 RepID=A0A2H0YVA7_9BACT|nr:MAG: aspartate aminotransferase [Candidatus Kerfeldbacteria bacterium CG08_land_8_20_14_0_20_40_16]